LAHAFIRKHRAWLTRKYAEAAASMPRRTFWEEACEAGSHAFPLRGVDRPFAVAPQARRNTTVSFDGWAFQVALGTVRVGSEGEALEQAAYEWGRCWLLAQISPMIHDHAQRLGVQPRHLRIKRMRTRWGSCGALNDINLNWLLIAAPPSVVEYVIVHELCHIRHRDHSARFWNLVAAHYPSYAQARGWLKMSGGRLLRRFGLCQ
jgi:predicted metal-dependent hydrolase